MKNNYVENFVNPKYYVPLNFSTLISYTESDNTSKTSVLRTTVSILMLPVMLISLINFWWYALAFSTLLAFFSFSKTSIWLQDCMGIIFPSKFFWIVTFLLTISVVFSVNIGYKDFRQKKIALALEMKKQQEQEIEKQKKQIEAQKEADLQRKEQQSIKLREMMDHQESALKLLKKNKYNDAINEFNLAASLANDAGRPYLKPDLDYTVANLFFVQRKWNDALKYYDKLSLSTSTHGDTLHFNKATCYVKLGDIESAVNTLRSGFKTKRTEALFDKINPVEKHLWRRNYRKHAIYDYRRKYGEW